MGKPSKCVKCGAELTRTVKDFAASLSTMRDDANSDTEAFLAKDRIGAAELRNQPPEAKHAHFRRLADMYLEIRSLTLTAEMEGRCQRCARDEGLDRFHAKTMKEDKPNA